MKTLLGFALGAVLSLDTAAFASSFTAKIAARADAPDPNVEVIFVTAKRPAMLAIEPVEPSDELVVTAKRAGETKADRTPPAMPIEIPTVELAVAAPPAVRF